MGASPIGDTTVERTNEPKIVLLVRLLNAIDEGRFSFEQLKDRIAEGEHKPSTRSLRRYLAVLADAGFPWYFDRATNTYRFSEGYSLKRLEAEQQRTLRPGRAARYQREPKGGYRHVR